jgi:hypothetical protein
MSGDAIDHGHGGDSLRVGVAVGMQDGGHHRTVLRVRRWDEDAISYALKKLDLPPGHDLFPRDFRRLGVRPYSETEHVGNLIMNTAWGQLITSYFGTYTAPTKFSATVGRIGIGIATSPAAAYTDTDLSAAAGGANRLFKFCAAAPTSTLTLATRSLAWTATFQAADAVFAWNEFGIDQGTADGTTVVAQFINHATSIAQGTKGSSQIWTANATLTFT